MNPLERLRYLHDSGIKAVILTNDLAKNYFNLVNYPHRRLSFTKNRIFMYTPALFYQKKSIFKDPYDIQLGRIRAAGLVDILVSNYADNRKSRAYREPSKIKVEHIFGSFEICGLMLMISFGVFILELMSETHYHIQKILDFFTY